jgi:hypothetical protein
MAETAVNENQAEIEDESLGPDGDELADERPEPDSRMIPDAPAES